MSVFIDYSFFEMTLSELTRSVCVPYDGVEGAIESVSVSVEVLGPDHVFVWGYIMRNIFLFGLYISLKLIEYQRLVECCCDF